MRTREREVAVLVVALTLVAVLSGCYLIDPTPTARFEITNWTQEYYQYSDHGEYPTTCMSTSR